MDKTLLEVDQAWLQKEIDILLDRKRKEIATKNEMQEALESDSALRQWVQKHLCKGAPVTRASTYNEIRPMQELKEFTRNDPRRPVIMKGAKYMLQLYYGCKPHYQNRPATYAKEVAKRYFRRYKITWKYTKPLKWPPHIDKMLDRLRYKLQLSHWNQQIDVHVRPYEYGHWIDGKWVDRFETPKPSAPMKRQEKYVADLKSARIVELQMRLPKRKELEKWRAAYDALTELDIQI